MTEQDFREVLQDALYEYEADGNSEIKDIRTFREAGLLTHDEGLVIKTSNGAEFQVTIKSR